jgi:cobalt transporter subunit CbtB
MAKNTTRRDTSATATSVASRALQIGLAALLGTFLIAGTGFAHIEAVHNAAHDTRHSLAFPCH